MPWQDPHETYMASLLFKKGKHEIKGWFTWGPKSQVPLMLASPYMEAMSQLFKPQETIKNMVFH